MSTTPASIIGTPTPRIDGPLKTSGTAQYAADFHFERMAHAVPVIASVASGRIRALDTSAAEKMPGVLLVLHHGNIGPLYRTVPGDDNATNSEVRSAFEDEIVRHWGQYIAARGRRNAGAGHGSGRGSPRRLRCRTGKVARRASMTTPASARRAASEATSMAHLKMHP